MQAFAAGVLDLRQIRVFGIGQVFLRGPSGRYQVEICSNTALDWRIPPKRISSAGSSAPGTTIHRIHPRWFGPNAYSGPSSVTPAQAPRWPSPSVQANAFDRIRV